MEVVVLIKNAYTIVQDIKQKIDKKAENYKNFKLYVPSIELLSITLKHFQDKFAKENTDES